MEPHVGEGIGTDHDILFAHSKDNGSNWSHPEALNSDAGLDTTDGYSVAPATDGSGNWVAVWNTSEQTVDGELVTDSDILAPRWNDCLPFVDRSTYGSLLFPPVCSQDASALTQDLYASLRVGIHKNVTDTYYVSSSGTNFSPVAIDDALYIDGQDSGLGSVQFKPQHQVGPP